MILLGVDFTDERIAEIRAGNPMSAAERDELLRELPTFEECHYSPGTLKAFDDRPLMSAAVEIWADYCRSTGLLWARNV